MSQSQEEKQIVQLTEDVVNRIAAGEVIQRPVNVIKELVENCIDAGATNIAVTVQDGGMKYLQVQDNGCGIRKADLGIVCERFTTSKLRKFEDLSTIVTFGFRGEALASISHVAHLTIVTKTANSPCAYRAKYSDGHLQGTPEACAGQKGTTIQAEELFYNVPIRKIALKSASEEHSKIVEMLTRYAIHNPQVAFSLRKKGESGGDMKTIAGCTREQNIATLFGKHIGTDLISIACEDKDLGFKVEALISSPQCVIKSKFNLLLFVNDRLVECPSLKRGLEIVYSAHLVKGFHPFAYMNLTVIPQNLDVNVHPTKQHVHFLHETRILEQIQAAIDDELSKANQNRKFTYQMSQELGNANTSPAVKQTFLDSRDGDKPTTSNNTKEKKVYAHQLVRTDDREQKIHAFFSPIPTNNDQKNAVGDSPTFSMGSGVANCAEPSTPGAQAFYAPASSMEYLFEMISPNSANTRVRIEDRRSDVGAVSAHISREQQESCSTSGELEKKEEPKLLPPEEEVVEVYSNPSLELRDLGLQSIYNLRNTVCEQSSPFLRNIVRGHTVVGCIDASKAVIQYSTGLYLVDVKEMSVELFYQVVLFRFGNFGRFELMEPAPLRQMLELCDENQGNLDEIVGLLQSKAAMLEDYFCIKIQDGNLHWIPQIVTGYTPQMEALPEFIQSLTKLNWNNEQECLEGICRCIAEFYSIKGEYCTEKMNSNMQPNCEWNWLVEFVLFPSFKAKLMPPKIFSQKTVISKLTDLSDLYKVFERC